MTDDHFGDYGLVMPFVNVVSKGGEYDDVSYARGWECGAIDAELSILQHLPGRHRRSRVIHSGNYDQLDLIAMKHEFSLRRVEPDEMPDSDCDIALADGWTLVEFTREG